MYLTLFIQTLQTILTLLWPVFALFIVECEASHPPHCMQKWIFQLSWGQGLIIIYLCSCSYWYCTKHACLTLKSNNKIQVYIKWTSCFQMNFSAYDWPVLMVVWVWGKLPKKQQVKMSYLLRSIIWTEKSVTLMVTILSLTNDHCWLC